MTYKKYLFLVVFALAGFIAPSQAQSSKVPQNWFTLDPQKDKVNGTGGDEALNRLKAKGKKGQTIIVAVLDSGVDYMHEDLKEVMWVNPGEIPNNGKDDDNNGYIDDIHGWNFIGGKDGRNVDKDSYEVAREFGRLSKKFENVEPSKLSKKDKKEYEYYLRVKADFEESTAESKAEKAELDAAFEKIENAFNTIESTLNKKTFSMEELAPLEKSTDENVKVSASIVSKMMSQGITTENLPDIKTSEYEGVKEALEISFNPNFDSRSIVGDNYNDLSNRFYGNNDVKGPDAFHGTHVAGIIAASRNNDMGVNGVADNVRIMSVRCVPDGDERDKDVANAIRYAVDNGASIINMSFGKGYSPNKAYVDEAVRYAQEHDVLLVHAAGNDSENNDTDPTFPNDTWGKKTFLGKKEANNWMEIGALNWRSEESRVARFSNYGKENVDLFAPGVAIYSTIPEGKYRNAQGTSMASPAAAGVAAIIRSYFPELSAKQVKEVLMNSTEKQSGMVVKPGTSDKVPFSDLCVTGGIVSATKAIEAAEKTKAKRVKKARWQASGLKAANGKNKQAIP